MADNKDFDSIMREITRGLSGDSATDIAYLKEQMEAYKDHEMGKEIIRACARLMYDLIPEDKKKDIRQHLYPPFNRQCGNIGNARGWRRK